jgi:hypothetical protein
MFSVGNNVEGELNVRYGPFGRLEGLVDVIDAVGRVGVLSMKLAAVDEPAAVKLTCELVTVEVVSTEEVTISKAGSDVGITEEANVVTVLPPVVAVRTGITIETRAPAL